MNNLVKTRLMKIINNFIYKVVMFIIFCFIIIISLFIIYILQNIQFIKKDIDSFNNRLDSIIQEFIKYRAELDIVEEILMEERSR